MSLIEKTVAKFERDNGVKTGLPLDSVMQFARPRPRHIEPQDWCLTHCAIRVGAGRKCQDRWGDPFGPPGNCEFGEVEPVDQ